MRRSVSGAAADASAQVTSKALAPKKGKVLISVSDKTGLAFLVRVRMGICRTVVAQATAP